MADTPTGGAETTPMDTFSKGCGCSLVLFLLVIPVLILLLLIFVWSIVILGIWLS